MTNHEIILKAALAAGIYTKEEAAEILSHALCGWATPSTVGRTPY